MKKILIIFAVLVILLIATVFILKRFYPEKLEKIVLPKIEQINNVDIKVTGDTAYIDSKMTAHNQSPFSLKIDSIRYKISVFDKVYLQNEEFLGINIAPGKQDTIGLKVKIPYAALIKDLRKALGKKEDSASYQFNVALIYSTILGRIKLPVSREARFKIPSAPEIRVVDISYKKMGLKSIIADATVKIINHGEINLIIRDVTYEMKISDHGTIKGNHKATMNIKPRGETEIHIPINIKIKNIGEIISDIIKNKDKYKYDLTINAVLCTGNMKIEPFHVNVTKSGEMELKK